MERHRRIFWHSIVTPFIAEDTDNWLHATVYDVEPSPKQKDWIDFYKKDTDTILTMNQLYLKIAPVFPKIIANVDKSYRQHLREDKLNGNTIN